ncbi:hypothetical protein [Sphingomonas asaccharolytica]|uniref:hypothetical protein n=1 Tax=Sphingomonas asaccharolytica TaxID=40681 RepID=UPI000A7B5139|nr:hypothetical protein [Sphingomonas asaccharolytica]
MKILTSMVMASFVLATFTPVPAIADDMSSDAYATEQCSNDRWADLGYYSYDHCYATAVAYYYEQTGGGGGGVGTGGGGGGGTFIGSIPGYDPSTDQHCASRLCNDGE